MPLNCTHYINFDQSISSLAVAIARFNPAENQQHAAFIYRNSADQLKTLDLQWHYRLGQSDPSDRFVWIDLPLDDISKTHLAAVCEVIYDLNQEEGVPYSISTEGASFLRTGEFSARHTHSGFTCATFILAVFHSQGFEVVDYGKWTSRPSDKKWHIQVVQKLAQSGASPEYIEAQKKELARGVDRFRPEEVCAAVESGNWPVSFEEIKNRSKEILSFAVYHRLNRDH